MMHVLLSLMLLVVTQGCLMQPSTDELDLARSAAQAFCREFEFPAEKIRDLDSPPISAPVSLDRDGRSITSYRWLGGGRGDYIVQVEIYQDYSQIVVYGGYDDQEFGPWNYDPLSQDRSIVLTPDHEDDKWHTVITGELVQVSVEKRMYTIDNSPYFWIHVRLLNLTDHNIGVDLHNPWTVVYPNQWAVSDHDHRLVIDEMRLIPAELDEELIANLIADFHNTLTTVRPEQVVDYYREFNGSGPAEIEEAFESRPSRYLLIVIDGPLFATDGQAVERLYCSDNADETPCFREMAVLQPVSWAEVPAGGLIIGK